MDIKSTSFIASRNRRIAITGAFSALIILMGIPGLHLGYIQISPTASLTIMHIPVVLTAILSGLPGAIVTGIVFGLTSLVNAAANPSGLLDPLFINPLCSVLPRVLFGVFVWILYNIMNLIPKMPKTLNAAITSFVGTIFHTIVVIGSMYVFLNGKTLEVMGGTGYFVAMGLILPGSVMESLAATIVCTAVIGAIFVTTKKKAKLFSEENK